MDEKIFDVLHEIAHRSQKYMENIKMAGRQGDKNKFNTAMCQYIQCRYVLEQCPHLSDNLYDLASMSIARAASLPPKAVRLLENESGCTGAKSPMIKKVLLTLSLMKEITEKLDEDAVSAVDTVGQLTDLCWMNKKNDM